MRLVEVKQFIYKAKRPKGWKIKISEPWVGFFKENSLVKACTLHDTKTIYFNKKFLKYFNIKDLDNTLKHEIAHALTWDYPDHGRNWYYVALKLGWSLEDEYKASQSFLTEAHKRKYKSFKEFIKVRIERDDYYLPRKYL